MIQIDFIFDADCPAASDARANLRAALVRAKLPPRWSERERSSPETPQSMPRFGSPTILINRRDVGGGRAGDAPSCRIYLDLSGRAAAIPPVELIGAALASLTEE